MRVAFALAALTATLAGCGQDDRPPAQAQAVGDSGNAEFKIARVNLPGEGRGDYIAVDENARRLYVTHTYVVHILDLDSLKPLAELTGLTKAHGVALANGRGFASDGGADQVVMFDLATGKALKTIATGQNPDSILHDPASGLVFVFNGASHDATVIDPTKGEPIKTIPLGDKPEFSQVDGHGRLWVNLEEGAAIAEIDTKALRVTNRWDLPDCKGAAALAFDSANRRLFASCGNKALKVVDADTGALVANLPIGEDADGIVFDPDSRRIFVANRDGAMTIVEQRNKDSYTVEQTLPTEVYAKTAAFDRRTHRVFTSTADLIWPKAEPGEEVLPDAKPGSFRLLVISEK